MAMKLPCFDKSVTKKNKRHDDYQRASFEVRTCMCKHTKEEATPALNIYAGGTNRIPDVHFGHDIRSDGCLIRQMQSMPPATQLQHCWTVPAGYDVSTALTDQPNQQPAHAPYITRLYKSFSQPDIQVRYTLSADDDTADTTTMGTTSINIYQSRPSTPKVNQRSAVLGPGNASSTTMDRRLDEQYSCFGNMANNEKRDAFRSTLSVSLNAAQDTGFCAAQKYFAESGVLGPIHTSNDLIRKTSRVLQDADVISQIRKTSIVLRTMKEHNKRLPTVVHNDPLSIHLSCDKSGLAPASTELVSRVSTSSLDKGGIQLSSFHAEIKSLKLEIKAKDTELMKLRREIHKLKSVLKQTKNDVCTEYVAEAEPQRQTCLRCRRSISNGQNMHSGSLLMARNYAPFAKPKESAEWEDESSKTVNAQSHARMLKKLGVSAESCEASLLQPLDVPIPKYDKDMSAKRLIEEAITDNDFLKHIDAPQVRELVESMYLLSIRKGDFLIREGDVGAHLYVSAAGTFEVIQNGVVLNVIGAGKALGELAILYNCTRTASIRVLSDAQVWVLDRRVFQHIMMRTGLQRIENSLNFLKSVPLLKNLHEEVLVKIADVLEVEFFDAGTYIIRQGATGDTFFIISQGTVTVTQKQLPANDERPLRTLGRGDYFGEQALINEDKRTANIIAQAPGVECLTLDRDSFLHLIGDLCELKEKRYLDEQHDNMLAKTKADMSRETFGTKIKKEFANMKLTDLEIVATVGIGGFGRVELVRDHQVNESKTYALKCLKKQHIVATNQEEHVFNERSILLACDTPFICSLYRTFRDEKYVYMLLEACMGGEIWTLLRDKGAFDESAAQFIVGCVLQAFDYLHNRGIIYRDLKPENLMLDQRGYIKLVDFGFAKYIGTSNKTWTFCGTPEYVAPEIILNKGHDRAVDYWATGILIYELLHGAPPFTSNDPMKTYNLILQGIDMIVLPKLMSRAAVQLIKKLCRHVPTERLGYQKGGMQDIKKHKWFLGFDWVGLESQALSTPIQRPLAHQTDTSYFDKFPRDFNDPPVETSGWDADF